MAPQSIGSTDLQEAHPTPSPGNRITHLHRLRHKRGHWVWVEAAFRLLDGREPATVLVAIRDVSERQRQSEELKLAKEAAEQASQAKTEFLAAMSHEIRTPLNAILGFTSLLCEANHLMPDDRRKLDVIHSSGAALLTIVDDILDFSKVEAGRIELDLRSFALPRLVEQVLAVARGVAAAKDLDIRSEIDACVPHRVVGDPDRLRQVLLNLLNNAVKFTPRGSVTLSLHCADSTGPDARLRFTVTDTGIGIAKEHQARLFQRFSQAHGSIQRDFGGTGLGLAIAKRLIGLMGGVIGFESAPGQGSAFWFTLTLPVASEPEAAVPPMRTEQPLAPPSARILLVEDVDINQELARAVLTGAGYAVEIASNGAEAVMAVQHGAYDVVLMDVQMPVMDGIAATERIRNLPGPQRHVPIIAMTANVLPEHVGRLKAAGMDDHIGKPFQKQALLDALLKWGSREADAGGQGSGGRAEAA